MSRRQIIQIISIITLLLVWLGKNISLPKNSTQEVTPTVTPTPAPANHGQLAKVKRVVDGDTIEIETGEKVRYIGINAPESVDPRRPVQCFGKQAFEKNKELVEGKTVELEKDVSDKDKYDRLLRYIWIGDILLNEQLVREGFAHSSSYPPDVKYQDRFRAAEKLARDEKLGLWGEICQPK